MTELSSTASRARRSRASLRSCPSRAGRPPCWSASTPRAAGPTCVCSSNTSGINKRVDAEATCVSRSKNEARGPVGWTDAAGAPDSLRWTICRCARTPIDRPGGQVPSAELVRRPAPPGVREDRHHVAVRELRRPAGLGPGSDRAVPRQRVPAGAEKVGGRVDQCQCTAAASAAQKEQEGGRCWQWWWFRMCLSVSVSVVVACAVCVHVDEGVHVWEG